MADFWVKHRGCYPKLQDTRLPAFNWVGLISYAIGSTAAYASPILPPVVGVFCAMLCYGILVKAFSAQPVLSEVQG